MATARRPDNSGRFPARQGRTRISLALDKGVDVPLLTLQEVCDRFGKGDWAVRRAVKDGHLRRVRRAGHQPYFLESDVVEWLRQEWLRLAPTTVDPVAARAAFAAAAGEGVKKRESPKGGQLTILELENVA